MLGRSALCQQRLPRRLRPCLLLPAAVLLALRERLAGIRRRARERCCRRGGGRPALQQSRGAGLGNSDLFLICSG